jgi:hypothetical protein
MITDDQLATFSNVLGSFIFVLIVLYHYLVSQPVRASNSAPTSAPTKDSASASSSASSSAASSSVVSAKDKKTQ